jgi:hypothetical protein
MAIIRAATVSEILEVHDQWIFVDVGFAGDKTRSCGYLLDGGKPGKLTFSDLIEKLTNLGHSSHEPLYLVLEAPLSVAFSSKGNPTGRSIERRGTATRYWYVGLGAQVTQSAMYITRALLQSSPIREIRLVEGFVSFKDKGSPSSHMDDVSALKNVLYAARSGQTSTGRIVRPLDLKQSVTDSLQSAFDVAGMAFGIPPVILVEPQA